MFLNVIWRAAWRASFPQRYLFYTNVTSPCSEKNLSVQVVLSNWVTEANKVLNVAVLKSGKVCLDVKYFIVKGEEILSSLMFLHVFVLLPLYYSWQRNCSF